MIDLTKLTAAPWRLHWCESYFAETARGYVHAPPATPCHFYHNNKTDAEFIALARSAFDVMMRRGWSASIDLDSDDPRKWYAVDEYGAGIDCSLVSGTKSYPLHHDPYTAIVEADAWYAANVEKKLP